MNNYTWTINKKQREFLDCKEPEVLYAGAARSGKSVALTLKAVKEASIQGNVVILARKWFSTLRASTLVTLLDGTAPYPPILPLGTYEHNRSEHTIKLHGGGIIRYIGISDDIQKIRSMACGSVFIDECTEIDENDWLELSLRICLPCGCQQIHGATNPSSQSHWLYKRFLNDKTDRRKFITTSATDNESNLPKRTMETLRSLTGTMKERMLEGKWVASDDFVYPNINDCIVEKPIDKNLIKRWYVGLDYGYTNPMAFVLMGQDSDNNFYIQDSYQKSNMLIQDVVERLNKWKDYDYTVIMDPSAAGMIADLQSRSFNVVKADNDVAIGIDRVRDLMNSNKLKIYMPNNKDVVTCLRNYMYGSDGKPVKRDDHMADSTRYIVQTVTREQCESIIEERKPKMFFSIA